MKLDEFELALVVVIFAIFCGLAYTAGMNAGNKDLLQDCQSIGAHRIGQVAIKCEAPQGARA